MQDSYLICSLFLQRGVDNGGKYEGYTFIQVVNTFSYDCG